jgi:transcriptional regulator with XRE-family HTH domain
MYADMEELIERQKAALKFVENIIELEPDQGTLAYALKMRERLKLPMSVVLDRLEKVWPDMSTSDRATKLGVSRQTYYGWSQGMFRPDIKLSKKLAHLTGFDAEEIRGQLPPRR